MRERASRLRSVVATKLMNAMAATRFQLADHVVDLTAREVRRQGLLRPMQPKAFDVLAFLIDNQDRAVTKDEILDAVWPNQAIAQGSVYRAIRGIRRVMEAGTGRRVVKTVHKVGYRLASVASPLDNDPMGASTTIVAISDAPEGRKPGLPQEWPAHVVEDNRWIAVPPDLTSGIAALLDIQATGDAPCPRMAVIAATDDASDQAQTIRTGLGLASVAQPGQILLSSVAFELARNHPSLSDERSLTWKAHGFLSNELNDPIVGVFEVGHAEKAGFESPPGCTSLTPAANHKVILGWRAAAGATIPGRTHWILRELLGEGGFGEAWLAEHEKSHEHRVFKFCYRSDRLASLKREVTLFRLIRAAAGQRQDIARILDWQFDRQPYFVESEYTPQGDLPTWLEELGGVGALDIHARIDLVVQTAKALAAAHSVGVLHKDVKPTNILIRETGGKPRIVLADFGIGVMTQPARLDQLQITNLTSTAPPGAARDSEQGSRLYLAPELLEGKPASPRSDIYALGVALYQLVIADFHRALGPGWERDINCEVLRGDLAAMVDGKTENRIADAEAVASRLGNLDARREMHRAGKQLEREKRRRRLLIPALAVVSLFALVVGAQGIKLRQTANRANAQAALAVERAATAEATKSFLIGLFESSDPLGDGQADLTARELLDRGSERVAQAFADEPETLADVATSLGIIYKNLGEYDQAHVHLLRAADLREGLTDGDPAAVASTRFMLGDLAYQRSRFDEGLEHLRNAIGMQRSMGEGARGDLAWSLYKLSHVHRRLGDATAAIAAAREALALARADGFPSPTRHGRMLSALASVRWMEGRLVDARGHFEEALAMTIEATGTDSPDTVAVQAKFADLLGDLGDYQRQEALARDALARNVERFGDAHLFVGETRSHLAVALAGQQRLPEAKREVDAALASLSASVGHHPSLGAARVVHGRILATRGDFDEAYAEIQAGLEIQRSLLGDDHLDVARTRFELARVAMAQGRFELAESEASRAETIVAAAGLADHWLLPACQLIRGQAMAANGDLLAETILADDARAALADALGSGHPLLSPLR